MGADPIKMVESNYTAVELAEAGMSAEDIAAAADAAGSGSTLEVSDLKLVEDMTAEILKENGFSANELMLGGFVAADLEDAGFSASAIKVAQSKYNRANPTNPATSAGTNQTLIIVAAVLILFVVLGAAVYIRRAKGAQQGSGDESPIAFENPMYADGYNGGQQPQGSAGYMDVPAGVGGGFSMQSGYMDVAPTSGGGASAAYMDVAPTENFDGSSMQSGYMDVAPTSGGGASAAYMDVAPTENFDGGFGGDGFDSDDEEV